MLGFEIQLSSKHDSTFLHVYEEPLHHLLKGKSEVNQFVEI